MEYEAFPMGKGFKMRGSDAGVRLIGAWASGRVAGWYGLSFWIDRTEFSFTSAEGVKPRWAAFILPDLPFLRLMLVLLFRMPTPRPS